MRHAVNRKIVVAIACSASLWSAQTGAAESEAPVFTVSMRGWVANWSSWYVAKGDEVCGIIGSPECAAPDVPLSIGSDSRNTLLIPSLSMRWGRWLLSGSYASGPRFNFSSYGRFGSTKREEADVTVGYYVFPSAAVTLGYKAMDTELDGLTARYAGPTVGFSGSAPLNDRVSVYGNAAFGLPGMFRAKLEGVDIDASNRNRYDMDYNVVEFGLAFPVSWELGGSLKSLVVSVGYRHQVASIKNYQLSSTAGPTFATSLTDATNGFTLGLSASF